MPTPTVPFSTLSNEDLIALRDQVAREIAKRSAREREDAKKKIKELADAHGLSLKEVLGKPTSKPNEKPALMRNPDNPMETWTGLGRKPEWYKRAIEAGIHPSTLRIPDNS